MEPEPLLAETVAEANDPIPGVKLTVKESPAGAVMFAHSGVDQPT